MIFASLFSGFGLADIGAMQAGCEIAWGVELDPQVAEVSRQLGHKIYNQSVLDINWYKLERPDYLWASPPCPNFSTAKTNGKETELDVALAQSVCQAIRTLTPKYFTLENVEGYKRSRSLQLIENTLYELGYWCLRSIVDAVDFGVPQNRRRLILRAIKGEMPPPLPAPVKWVGWYSAIADLVDDLPEVELAPWQLRAVPEWLRESILLSGKERAQPDYKNAVYREGSKPVWTVRASDAGHLPKAVLIEGAGARSDRPLNTRLASEPSWTIKSSVGANGTVSRLANALLESRTVSITPRALGRFQTLPDWYELPQSTRLAVKGIGNGVPCLLAKEIIRSLVSNHNESSSHVKSLVEV